MISGTVSHYKVLEKLGGGAMGVVYEAEDTRLGRHVALKFLPQELGGDPRALERFRREALAVSALNHPHICTLHDIGEHEGQPFLVMELMEGKTLRHILGREPLPPAKVIELGAEIADALDAAHAKGIVHRDVKPENLFLTERGHVKVLDFGLAQLEEILPRDKVSSAASLDTEVETATHENQMLTRPGLVLGTVFYMSPEQVRCLPLDARTDLFSLGVVLYELVTGRLPFDGATPAVTFNKILNKRPAEVSLLNPDVPSGLSKILTKALEKDRELRYQSARELLTDLRRLQGDSSGRTQPPSLTAEGRSRRRLWAAVAVTAFIAALVLVVTLFLGKSHPSADTAAAASATPGDSGPSIAVLYFENLTGNPELEWLRHGLTDMLVTDLSQSRDLTVLSTDRLYQILAQLHWLDERMTSFDVVQEVARQAHVKTVLLGSYMKVGDTIRINVKLQEASTGKILATNTVEGPGGVELFAMVDDLSRDLRQRFDPVAEPGQDRALMEATTASVDAFRSYSEGVRLHMEVREEAAVELFRKAVEIDSSFAMAWARMAISTHNLSLRDEALEYGAEAMKHLDRVTPRERYYIEANYFGMRTETLNRAIETLERAHEEFPTDPVFTENLASCYSIVERFTDAIRMYNEALRLGGLFKATAGNMARTYADLGEFDKGRRVLEEFLQNEPGSAHGWQELGRMYVLEGRLGDALESLAKAEELRPGGGYQDEYRWYAQALLEDWTAAETISRKLERRQSAYLRLLGVYLRCVEFGYRGHTVESLDHLAQAIESSSQGELLAVYSNGLAAEYWLLGRSEPALMSASRAQSEAKETLTRAVALSWQSLALQDLGRATEADVKADEIEDNLEEVVGPFPERLSSRLRGLLALSRGKHKEAVHHLESADALLTPGNLDPSMEHVLTWFSLGEAYLSLGEDRQAAEWYGKVANAGFLRLLSPVLYVRSLYRLGEVHERLGKPEKAKEYYRRFLGYWEDGDVDRERVERARRFVREEPSG